jgi:hypothetical protein
MNLGGNGNRRWGLLAAALAGGVLLAAMVLLLLPSQETEAESLGPQLAHVVVQFADGATAVRPISWTGTISRVAALQTAGFTVEHGGDAVCSIAGEGCPSTDCWCSDNLWAQGQWDGSGWDTLAFPPPLLQHGDVIAFRNGTQPDYSDWGLTGLLPGAPTYVAASDALEWMRGKQQADGSYNDGLGAVGASVRALTMLGAAGYDPDGWGSPSLLHYLTVVSPTETAEYAAKDAASAGKLAVGAAWTRQTVTDFVGINLPISLTSHFSPTTGGFGGGSGDTAWAVLGLAAMGEDVSPEVVDYLVGVQNPDGGWAWNEWGTSSEVQHTATVVQALLAAGTSVTSTEVISAVEFIASGKNGDGGYAYMPPGASDVATTAYAVQALLSSGTGQSGDWCSEVDLAYLLRVQQADGSFPSLSLLYATQEVVPALMHRPLGPLADWSYNCHKLYLPQVSVN